MKIIFVLLISIFINQSVIAHEDFFQNIVKHGHFLKKLQVNSFGDLRLIRDNKLTQSLLYSKIKTDDLYGIGMSTGLDKELLMSSGTLYEGYFDKNIYSAGIAKEDRNIAFLAYVNVKKWKEIKVPEDIKTFAQLETSLPILAKNVGINSSAPFPFILRSKIDGLKWFIVDGIGNGKPDYLSSFLRSRYIGGLEDEEIEGVGFYSDKHKGILSAPNSSMHIHFRTLTKPLFVGHIDNELFLAKGATLQFPATE